MNAHQLTGDATDDDDHHHDIVGADDETKMQANRNLKIQFPGSVFSHWKVARWAQKLRLENRFELKDGKLTVRSPGIYYLYAQVCDISLQPEFFCFREIHETFQINYLDESDVNGFQIYVNDSPIFLCTAMTHTPTATTKANTCYTGGFS